MLRRADQLQLRAQSRVPAHGVRSAQTIPQVRLKLIIYSIKTCSVLISAERAVALLFHDLALSILSMTVLRTTNNN